MIANESGTYIITGIFNYTVGNLYAVFVLFVVIWLRPKPRKRRQTHGGLAN